MSQPKRKPKPVGNPLRLIAAKTPIGAADTDKLLFPFSSHLYEVAMGHGYGESIRCLTLQLAAAYQAATTNTPGWNAPQSAPATCSSPPASAAEHRA